MNQTEFNFLVFAQDMKEHAEKLQKRALETFSALPDAVDIAAKKIRSMALRWALISALAVVASAAVSFGAVVWMTADLRDEAATLRKTVVSQKAALAELRSETWGLDLITYTGGEKGIILPKGQLANDIRIQENGRKVVVLSK